MASVEIDTRGLKCPLPVLKITSALVKDEVAHGDTLVVIADCPTFEKDVRDWCQKMKKVLIAIRWVDERTKKAEIRI
jgi:tRNA 2-thiouridine synthesizing protein A